MPGIAHKINTHTDHSTDNHQNQLTGNGMVPFHSFDGSSVSSNGFWLKHREDVSLNQLRKFWCELTPHARHKLMRVDKQTLFEHARKQMYCSRCNGLLLEGFLQIGMYGKSLQQDTAGIRCSLRVTNNQNDDDLCTENGWQDDTQDPSVLPWGGLTTARDGTLTLLDCYLCSKSLKGLQNVFNSSRVREREREMLYPDACGGGGRGWISQGIAGYGRGHGTRETCALHTARLSVETLVAFWLALGEDTQQSLLRMKEDDFVERLMYRFDRKRFCRDCRRNVIREFKELKELKRMRREPRCTSWFCAADSAFQYEVSLDSVQADWHQTFLDAFGEFHRHEWAIGTGEGKSDIMEFENVGLSKKAQLNGLDLSSLNACYITLRTWKMNGRCNELCVKAHALQGQKCIHCRLVVGDGFVTMTTGENIRRFFEHAEEAEEEEDDDSLDKDGNELDGDCSRPQKHAKSPELAREFLLDAATVIFKEQVEKAFREGTARQNAHSMFVCLALKLLEERLHVACKEIITLEKQMKLLEEEEKEKREEEERKERRKTREREKKLRRKERLREKEKRENKCGAESSVDPLVPDISKEEKMLCVDEKANVVGSREFVCETGEATPATLLPPDMHGDQLLIEYMVSNMVNHSEDSPDGEFSKRREWNPSFLNDRIKYSRRKLRFHKDPKQDFSLKWSDIVSASGLIISNNESRCHADVFESTRNINGFKKQLGVNVAKSNIRNGGPGFSEEIQCTNNRIGDRYDSHACSCNHHNENRSRPELHIKKVVQEPKSDIKFRSPSDISTPYYLGNGNKYPQLERTHEVKGQPKSKIIARHPPKIKKVWEPLDSRRKHTRSNSDFDVLQSSPKAAESDLLPESSAATSSDEVTYSVQTNSEDDLISFTVSGAENCRKRENAFRAIEKSQQYSKEASAEGGKLCSMTRSPRGTLESSMISPSNFDNCSSCLSEGDSNISSSNSPNMESDSEEASQNSDGKETSCCLENGFTDCHRVEMDPSTASWQASKTQGPDYAGTIFLSSLPAEAAPYYDNRRTNVSSNAAQPQNLLPRYAVFHAPIVGYYHQNSVSWQAGPTNELMPFPHTTNYLCPSSFGFGLNGNAQFMQYGTLQHLPPPLLNPVHLPVFQPVAPVNGVTAKVHAKVADLSGLKEGRGSVQDMAATNQHPAERPTAVDILQNQKSDKEDMGNCGFSLFHFGGPVALSTGFKADTVSLREGLTQHTSSNLSVNCSNCDQFCNKKDSIEEYNLFAASNALKFSLL